MVNGDSSLHDLLKNFDVAMLVTHDAKEMRARPMVVARLDKGMDAYLLTGSDSAKLHEICKNPDVLLTFQSSQQFASLRGEVVVVQDRALLETMWKEAWKVWFPGGKADPNIAILKFTPNEGEFWDNAGIKGLKYAYSAAKAYIVGGRPNVDIAQHNRVKL